MILHIGIPEKIENSNQDRDMKLRNNMSHILIILCLIITIPVKGITSEMFTNQQYSFLYNHNKYKPILNSNLFYSKIFNVKDFGAIGDGQQLETNAINNTIKECSKKGGGIVFFPKGIYKAGSIRLRSNITIYLDNGAIIRGAENNIHAYDEAEENIYDLYQDFGHSHWRNALLWGEGLSNIRITGGGIIDGGGITSSNKVPKGGGDKILSLKLCRNISVSGITMKQGGHFAILATGCVGMEVYDVTIRTERDGIDLMQCSYVNIYNCDILSERLKDGKVAGGDDAIGIKSDYSLGYVLPSHNIYIRNCKLGSGGANGIQFGSETVGPIRDVYISDCEILFAGKAGLGITSNDGSIIENVTFSNIKMEKVATPIFMLISDRLRAGSASTPGRIKNIVFNRIIATDVFSYAYNRAFAATLNGLPDFPITDIVFNNIKIKYKGGGTSKQAKIIPPTPENYSPRFLGIRPSYGFYCRNIERVEFYEVDLSYEKPDYRPGFIFENTKDVLLGHILVEHEEGVKAIWNKSLD